MEIKNIDIGEIKPYEKNPRNNDKSVPYVLESIKEFGFKIPIILDKNNIIVCGHTRYKAAKKLGMKEIPCIYADDLTDEQIKAFRLADNKVGEKSEWDFDLLGSELSDILDIDMEKFDFDFSLDDENEGSEKEVVEDDFHEEIQESIAKKGDIFQLGKHRLMCGDSTKSEDIEKLLDGNSIDLVLTDPPYGICAVDKNKIGGDKPFGKVGGGGKVGGKIGDGKIVKAKIYMQITGDDSTDTAKEFYKTCVSLGINNFIIFGGNYFTDFLDPKPCWLAWDKQNTGDFADVELAWTSFDKPARLYSWLWNGMVRKGAKSVEGETRVHPTQKPVGMLGEILKDFSKENDNILDCFGGSGSTLIACEQLDRKCLMMEYEPYYVDVIIKRWENFTGQKAILLT